ncbi:MAG: YitT family protein [Oscillospiraceae bacterium]|nr:YitT family protein [Oscillospiraceae bacterium]MDD6085694.1 YitT family protein [Oscillospiraceae bacterium]
MKIAESIKKIKITNIILLTIAGIINAFGVVVFLAPVKLYDSGISGTSMLISQVTPSWCSLSLILILLNVPVFIFGLKKKGLLFTVYAIYAVLIYSLCAWIITDILPVDVSIVSPLAGKDLFLCAIFGGIISGCGSGMAIRFGGAIDGIDIVAVIFSKKMGLSVGTFVMIYNVILYIICGFVVNSWILPLYSIVTYAAASKTVDYIVDGFDRAKAAIIITIKPDKVCAALSETFENGITILDAKGYYSGSEKGMLYFVLNRFQIGTMREIVHEIDPTAYISINDVADIYSANNKNL